MSVHSTMMGGNASLKRDGTLNYSRNGSVMSGSIRGSTFQRGGPGSIRGSDRSMRSSRRDIDDIALSMHHMGGSQHFPIGASTSGVAAASSGYGRKELDDMVRSRSHFFKRENSLLLETEQPHGIMILDGDGLMRNQQRFQVITYLEHAIHLVFHLKTISKFLMDILEMIGQNCTPIGQFFPNFSGSE